MDHRTSLHLLESARSATLGTVDQTGRPHLVPVVFAYQKGYLYTAVDHKPKSTRRLKRLRNIQSHPQVSVLVDHYQDDWTGLWWIRIDGTAQVIESGSKFDRAVALLAAKYAPYATQPPAGPAIVVRIDHVRGWSAS